MLQKLHIQVLLGIIFGATIGTLVGYNSIIDTVGILFLRSLRMVIVPLVFASLVMGIVSLGNIKHLGKIGLNTFLYYIITTLLAVSTGIFLVTLLKPGVGTSINMMTNLPESITNSSTIDWMTKITEIVPENILKSFTDGNMLALICFSLIFGCALTVLGRKAEPFVKVIDSLNDIMLKITEWIILLSPIGVFALVSTIVSRTGIEAFKSLAFYVFIVLIGLVIHVGITLSATLFLFTKQSPSKFFRKMVPALATAFSTDSSLATLPITMECLEKNVGASNKVTSFVAPLGATMNMDGTALYQAIATIFIAQVAGVDLSLTQLIVVLLTVTLASIGTAGIPSASLVTTAIVLNAINVPLEGIGLILAVDRLLDMLRTAVNVTGDGAVATIVASSEDQLDREMFRATNEHV